MIASLHRPARALVALGLLLLLPGLGALEARADAAAYRVETLAEGLEHPWSIAFLPDGGMLVTERAGRLRHISAGGTLRPEPLEGLPPVLAIGQGGLMEVALAPDFDASSELYLSYTCGTEAANNTCLARARLRDDRLVDVREIFRARPDKAGGAHYGGRIAFLPDGTLLLTLGDAFVLREEAQRPGNHLGSIVRLNADGSVPADNPFVGRDDARPEIFSYGHRNVQGIVVTADGTIYSHEHGPRGGDELNRIEPGVNYGWPLATHGIDYTGARISPYTTLPGLRDALLGWTPSIAPAGMTLYDGELFPKWRGELLISALAGKAVHRVRVEGGRAEEMGLLFQELEERLRDVRSGPDGAIYLLTDTASGKVLRVVPAN